MKNETKKPKSTNERQARFKAENLKLGRKPRPLYTTEPEHAYLKKRLEDYRKEGVK